jgi:Ni,Fe-hydrogenase III small subunit/formate hydrogenlyase subunit 6/NADH:ubiquinone oxidoreductase subunit I
MFRILRQSFSTGIVTTSYPRSSPEISTRARGAPEIDFANWKDARPAAQVCPTSAISFADDQSQRAATLDLGKCIFCGLCAESDPAIRMTNRCELAARQREDLRISARYQLRADGTHEKFLGESPSQPGVVTNNPAGQSAAPSPESFDLLGRQLKARVERIFGRSLHIREVDAGSCNGCEIEIVGLTSPIYDVERFGIHFAASPRHADMLLVTGPVSRNMELALRQTYEAMPAPRLVVAVGACGCSGGIFGANYASLGGVDQVVPVDVYIPGCPPNPCALLHGILLAIERIENRSEQSAGSTV